MLNRKTSSVFSSDKAAVSFSLNLEHQLLCKETCTSKINYSKILELVEQTAMYKKQHYNENEMIIFY